MNYNRPTGTAAARRPRLTIPPYPKMGSAMAKAIA